MKVHPQKNKHLVQNLFLYILFKTNSFENMIYLLCYNTYVPQLQ